MARKELALDEKQEQELALVPQDNRVIELSDMIAQMGFNAPPIKAEELSGIPIYVNYYKRFNSDMNPRGYAYWAIITREDTGELVTTVLGGDNVVDWLDRCHDYSPGAKIHMLLEKRMGKKGLPFWVVR